METLNKNKIDQKVFALKLSYEIAHSDALLGDVNAHLKNEIKLALDGKLEVPYMELKDMISHYGTENCYFLAKLRPLRSAFGIFHYTSTLDETQLVLCTIDEKRYKVSEGYKICLKPIYDGYQNLILYQSDLMYMIRDNQIKILTDNFNFYDKQQ